MARRTRPARDALASAAVAIRRKAYAPYSNFQVGAAVRDETGAIHAGCNVENAAYQGTCAESGAIAAMIAAGGKRIREVVVSGPGRFPCTPCGGCRQRIREFAAPGTKIRTVDGRGRPTGQWTLAELLPVSFGPGHLK